jgi:two-component system, chemotaxis family, sensor kinase CheA
MSSSADPTETFRQESSELLEQLEQSLLDLEQRPDDKSLVNSAFRALHTLKGSGGMFGFAEVAAFVHEFETAFDKVRKGLRAATPELIAVALDAKDHVHKLIQDPGAPGGDEILAQLRLTVDIDKFPEAPLTAPAGASGPAVASAAKNWRIKFKLPADALINGTNLFPLLEEIEAIGPCTVKAVTDDVPMLTDLDPEVPYVRWEVDLQCDIDPSAAIDDVFLFLRDGMELSIEPLPAEPTGGEIVLDDPAAADEVARPAPGSAPRNETNPAAALADKPDKAETADRGGGGSSLRVAAERLDELMDRVGELVIAQARLSQIANTSSDGNLKTIAEELERLSSGLRDTTMGIRMVPIGSIFSRFRRLVHDLSRELGKEIEFITTGEETELDKTMIEKLADPLVHLIRNSVDHGLEDAAARVARGKPAKGTVKLSAVYAGAEVAISVSDDGAGLNHARLRAKAEENGLVTADQKLTDQELNQLIFAPGFSTADEITSLSGRGVGMDVVKRTIDALRGTIEVMTRPGEGTTITLRLPLTLAIIDGMLVRIGNGRYTIPLSAVEECVELPESAATSSRGRNFLDIRGTLVPFIRLREVFNTPGEADTHQKVVIVSSGEGRVGLVVDQIVGNNQTVIKQLSKLHSGIKSFSGATILGDGTVALILDTAHLVGVGQVEQRNAQRNAA